jgi:surfeit locus 1 family protein
MTRPGGAEITSPVAPRSSKARWLAATCALLLCLGFIALGSWQVFRLQWKLDLIARVERRVHAPAIAIPPAAAWPAVNKQADEYRHVHVSGLWMEGADALVQATTDLGSGYWLLSPLCTAEGIVFVNRGFVAPSRPRPAHHAAACPTSGETVSVTGLLRLPEPGGGFLRSNDPAHDKWYSRDIAALSTARGLTAVAPFFIDQEAAATPALPNDPVGGLTVLSFTNNHLVYALTWFGMALLAAAGGWLLLRENKRSRAA